MNGLFEIIKNMQLNPIVWLILSLCTVVGVIGIPIAIYFGIKGRVKKQISFTIISNTIVQNASSNIPDIRILYKDNSVENLVISRLAIWNSGNTIINKEDVVNCEPIKTVINEGTLLDVTIIKQNNKSNQFTITKFEEANEALIKFDYLEKMMESS